MPERPPDEFRPTLESALLANEREEIGPWLQAFLREAERPNLGLADGLLLVERSYLMIEYPLASLSRSAGPEPECAYPYEPDAWAAGIASMRRDVEAGWAPPPLVVPGRWLALADGNHRHAVLSALGHERYWTIFFFERDRDANLLEEMVRDQGVQRT